MKYTSYEWIAEQVSADGEEEITNVTTVPSYADALRMPADPYCFVRIALVRDYTPSPWGHERLWAYVTDLRLPEHFEDAFGATTETRVPQRFHREVERANRGE